MKTPDKQLKKVKAVKRLRSRGKKRRETREKEGNHPPIPQTKKQWKAGKRRKKAGGRPENK